MDKAIEEKKTYKSKPANIKFFIEANHNASNKKRNRDLKHLA